LYEIFRKIAENPAELAAEVSAEEGGYLLVLACLVAGCAP
jgi:hypothetical protein